MSHLLVLITDSLITDYFFEISQASRSFNDPFPEAGLSVRGRCQLFFLVQGGNLGRMLLQDLFSLQF